MFSLILYIDNKRYLIYYINISKRAFLFEFYELLKKKEKPFLFFISFGY